MDSLDAFKKLAAGTKFDVNRFRRDAERFRIVRKPVDEKEKIQTKVKEEDDTFLKLPMKRKLSESDPEESIENDIDEEVHSDENNKLVLIDGISVSKDGTKKRTKKKKPPMTNEKKLKLEKEKIAQFRNKHQISVTGPRIPDPVSTFEELSQNFGLSQNLIDNIRICGYLSPAPIQMQAIPIMLEGRQLLACAPTGSGKTAAFLLPIIHHLGGPQKKGFRAIVLSPTRELAKQTYRECMRLSEGYDFRIHIISKVNQALTKYGPKSSQKYDILITTPKRLVFLLSQEPPAISLNNVQWLVVDEADKLFEDGTRGFRDQLEEISRSCTDSNLRRAFFSATNTPVVTKWCRQNLKGLITVTVGHRNAATDLVHQELLFVGNERGKLVAFRNIIQNGMAPPVLVFVQSKERAQELFKELIYDGINVDVIHADRTQTQRDNVVRCFREGKIWVLICTELMGRGIDFKGVNLVINYDFPPSAISYVHRIGRTGRAGHKGKAITFFTQEDTTNLRSIAAIMRASGCDVPDYMLTMKKHNKKEKRKLERAAPKRESISTLPRFKLHKNSRKRKQQKSPENKISHDESVSSDQVENLNEAQPKGDSNNVKKKKQFKGNLLRKKLEKTTTQKTEKKGKQIKSPNKVRKKNESVPQKCTKD